MGMAQAGQERSLTLELALRLRVEVEVFVDGDAELESLVEGQVDGPHAAPAQLVFDAVAVVKDGAGVERHARDCMWNNRAGQSDGKRRLRRWRPRVCTG